MMPGVDPRQMKAMMKKLGMHEEQIHAIQVVIRTPEYDLVIDDPKVSLITMMGQSTYQIIGQATKVQRPIMPSIDDEDVRMVMDQTGVDYETAKQAIEESNGDLAEAIVKLKE